jgi:hypothetical protein
MSTHIKVTDIDGSLIEIGEFATNQEMVDVGMKYVGQPVNVYYYPEGFVSAFGDDSEEPSDVILAMLDI